MTKPLQPEDMQRPGRRLGEVIRTVVSCPLCGVAGPEWREVHPVRIVAFRTNTVRVECPACGLRFSFRLDDFDRALAEGNADQGAAGLLAAVTYFRLDDDGDG